MEDTATKERIKRMLVAAGAAGLGTAVGYGAGSLLGNRMRSSAIVRRKLSRMSPKEKKRLLMMIRATGAATGAAGFLATDLYRSDGNIKV